MPFCINKVTKLEILLKIPLSLCWLLVKKFMWFGLPNLTNDEKHTIQDFLFLNNKCHDQPNQGLPSLGKIYKSFLGPGINLQMCIVSKYLTNLQVIGKIWFCSSQIR